MPSEKPSSDDQKADNELKTTGEQAESTQPNVDPEDKKPDEKPNEVGGPKGPEPTRYGDWEHKGRCIDF